MVCYSKTCQRKQGYPWGIYPTLKTVISSRLSCSCDRVHEDGVDISAYVEGIGDRVVALIGLSDCKGRISRSDLDKAMGHVDVISGTVSQLYNFLANEPKEGKEVRLPKD